MKKFSVIIFVWVVLLSSCGPVETLQLTLTPVAATVSTSSIVAPASAITPQPTILPTLPPTPQKLSQLQPLTLPEFDARYSTGGIAMSQDGKFMAVVSNNKFYRDYSIWVWDVNDLSQSIVGYKVDVGTLWSIAFDPSGINLAFGGISKITIVNWKTGDVINDIDLPELPNSEPVQLEFGKDNTLVFSSFLENVSVWELLRDEVRYSVEGLTGFHPSSFAISPDGDMLATGAYDGIHLWDFETGQSLGFLEGADGGIGIAPTTVFSDKGNFLASTGCSKFIFESCSSGKILIWKSDSEIPTIISNVHSGWIDVLAFSLDEEFLASGDARGAIKLIRLADGKVISVPSLGKPGQTPPNDPLQINDMTFLPDGKTLLVSTNDGIQLLDIAKMSWVPNLRFILGVEYSYMITREGDNLNLRMGPSLREQVLKILRAGQWFTVIEGPELADGFIWWKIKLVDGTEGWIVEMPDWYANPP
jgi:WD40 repeat protein